MFLFLNLKLAASSIWATAYLIIPISGLWCKFLLLLPFAILDIFFWGVGFFNSANSFAHSLCIQVPLVTTWGVLAFLLDPQCSLIRKHRTKLWSFLLFLVNGVDQYLHTDPSLLHRVQHDFCLFCYKLISIAQSKWKKLFLYHLDSPFPHTVKAEKIHMSALEEGILKKDIGNCFPLSLGYGKFGSGIWDMLITSHSGNFMTSSWPFVNVCKGNAREWWLGGWKFLTLKWLLLQMFAAVLRASKYLTYQCSLDFNPCFGNNAIILTQTALSTSKSDDLSLLKNLGKMKLLKTVQLHYIIFLWFWN